MTSTTTSEPAHPVAGRKPAFGFTRLGHAVHARTIDHMPDHNAYVRFNKRLAVLITGNVGTMTCFWLFCVIALLGLPAALVEAHVVTPTIGLIGEAGFVIMVQWIAQSFLQLILLPSLMVGQNLQNEAADARSAKTFEDVERIIDLLDCNTQGGLHEVLAAVEALRADLGRGQGALGAPAGA
ncbi:MAG: hypothetical protein ACYCXN_13710 [Acidimicrobiales bacterium]|jgi:hypothetical protein